MGVGYNTDSIGAQNTFSTPLALKTGGVLTLTGTFTATVSLQRQVEGTSTWVDVTNNSGTATTFTTIGTYTISPVAVPATYRWGVKTGNYTSGTVVGTLAGQ